MARNLAYLLGIILTILVGIYFYCSCCNLCNNEPATTEPQKEKIIVETPKATSFPFSINDNGFTYEVQDNFNFNTSTPSFLLPLTEGLQKGVDTLSSYLSQNPDKVIDLTGYYTSNEENGTAYPNLGIARANSVKNHFVTSGISSKQINTMGKLMDDMIPDENIYYGAVSYAISEKNENSDAELQALYNEIKANPLVLYFNTGEASIALTAEQRQKVANISRYLDKVDDTSCQVTGHTDNTGGRATNIRLGQERANFAKAYLTRNGILESKINATSDGPDKPIDTNATAEGRRNNRRVVVTLN
jgi:outer membrane protein OmpA-like peptidoglycan-associated protein